MEPLVGIVDYQMGNLRSVQKGIERVGGRTLVSSNPVDLLNATHLILPGVGAFGDAMTELRKRGLISFLRDWTASDKPFLGICLGMQLLFETGYEHGEHTGLGVLPGNVVRFEFEEPSRHSDVSPQQNESRADALPPEQRLKVPHMGWNQVRSLQPDNNLLHNLGERPYFYFVHSYYVVPQNRSDVWLESEYGIPFCAAVRRRNLIATQFHPEKSQRNGLELLRNFLNIGSNNVEWNSHGNDEASRVHQSSSQ